VRLIGYRGAACPDERKHACKQKPIERTGPLDKMKSVQQIPSTQAAAMVQSTQAVVCALRKIALPFKNFMT
jgi:hypothetical protein